MKRSYFLQEIAREGNDERLCFHSLYGWGQVDFIYDPQYVRTLASFSSPRDICEADDASVVQNLINAGYLIDDHVSRSNEREKYDHMIAEWLESVVDGRQIDYMDLMVSETCNFACGHCSRKYTINADQDHQLGLMTWQTAKKAIDWYFHNCQLTGTDVFDIHFGSDEPLLNWHVVKRAVVYIRSIRKDAVISINTNLSLLTREMAEFFRDHDVDVITSLDGLADGNDLVRVFPDGVGTFDTIYKNVQLCADVGHTLSGFITTILDRNWDHVDVRFVDWLAQQKFRSIAIDVDLVNSMSHSPMQCVEKLITIHDAAQDHGMVCGGAWTNPSKLIINGSVDGVPAHCKSIKGKGIAVTSDGYIQPCSGCGVHIGHIDDPQNAFAAGGLFHQLISAKMITADTRCDGCMLEAVCKNQCFMTSSGLGTGDVVRKKEMCYILRETTKHLLQLHLHKEIDTLSQQGG
jgi:radical SAM protein with 4Fe4S-binding SPASM domain